MTQSTFLTLILVWRC